MSTDPLDNDGRAGFAATALAAYYDETRYAPDGDTYGDEGSEQFATAFGDLLGDLQHLARRAGVDFHEVLAHGTSHFEEEVREEEELAREEAELARQAQEEEALKNGPVDDQVYAALTDDPTHFGYFKATSGLDPAEIRRSLLRLQEQGKAELVSRADTMDGKGWRRVPSNG